MLSHRLLIWSTLTATVYRSTSNTMLTYLNSGINGFVKWYRTLRRTTMRSVTISPRQFQPSSWGMKTSKWSQKRHWPACSVSCLTSLMLMKSRIQQFIDKSKKFVLQASKTRKLTSWKTPAIIWVAQFKCTQMSRWLTWRQNLPISSNFGTIAIRKMMVMNWLKMGRDSKLTFSTRWE